MKKPVVRTAIAFQASNELTNPADFSKATIAAQIEAGIQAAEKEGLGWPQ